MATAITKEKIIESAVKLTQRVGFQYTSRSKAGQTVWEEALVARSGFEWDLTKKHTWEIEISVNGASAGNGTVYALTQA